MEKEITLDFTGFVFDKINSFCCHSVYRKDDKYICVTTPYDGEDEYYDVHNIHIEDKEIIEDDYICTFYDKYDLFNLDGSLVQGPLEAIKI